MTESLPVKSLKCPNCGANVPLDCVRCDYCRAVLSMTACPSCFGPVFKGMKFCPECGAAVERRSGKSRLELQCPRCEIRLTPADIADTTIHECSCCGGLWLDTASFEKICVDKEQQEKASVYPSPARLAEPDQPRQERRFYVPCPECGQLMNRKNYAGCSGVVIDICKPHGMWFDRQELQQIIGFIRDGGLRKARDNELASLKAEQSRLQSLQYGQGTDPLNRHVQTGFGMGLAFHDERDAGILLDTIRSIFRRIMP